MRDGDRYQSAELYRESHALLVGASKYRAASWPPLESVLGEISMLEELLKASGFDVDTVLDPDGDQLLKAFGDFIRRHGQQSENRLFFWFGGHGYTLKDKGYLVPVDASDPDKDVVGFRQKVPRSAICKGELGVAIVEGGLSFFEFGELLQEPVAQDGLGCERALNLDGGPSTQVSFAAGRVRLDIPGVWKVHHAIVVKVSQATGSP